MKLIWLSSINVWQYSVSEYRMDRKKTDELLQSTCCRATAWGCERKWYCSNIRHYCHIWRDWGKPGSTWVKIIGSETGVPSEGLSTTSLKYHEHIAEIKVELKTVAIGQT